MMRRLGGELGGDKKYEKRLGGGGGGGGGGGEKAGVISIISKTSEMIRETI